MLKNEWSRVYESSKVNGERDERVKGPVKMEYLEGWDDGSGEPSAFIGIGEVVE